MDPNSIKAHIIVVSHERSNCWCSPLVQMWAHHSPIWPSVRPLHSEFAGSEFFWVVYPLLWFLLGLFKIKVLAWCWMDEIYLLFLCFFLLPSEMKNVDGFVVFYGNLKENLFCAIFCTLLHRIDVISLGLKKIVDYSSLVVSNLAFLFFFFFLALFTLDWV